MKILSKSVLALVLFALLAVNGQAQMAVTLQQQDGVVETVNNQRQMITSDKETFSLGNDQLVEKATHLQGKRVHILFYAAGDKKKCVDLRSAEEQAFDLAPPSGR
jgi:hypothetical protein